MNCAVCTHELIGLHHLARYCSSLCRRTAVRERNRRRQRGKKRKRNPEYWRRKQARALRRKFCKRYRNDRAFRKKVRHRHACRHYARKLGFASYPEMQRQQRAIRAALRKPVRAQRERERIARRRTPEERELHRREYRREYNSKPANRQRRNERARHRRRIARTVVAALREMDWLDERYEFKVGLWNWLWLDPPRSRHDQKHRYEKRRAAIVHVARELELLPQGRTMRK